MIVEFSVVKPNLPLERPTVSSPFICNIIRGTTTHRLLTPPVLIPDDIFPSFLGRTDLYWLRVLIFTQPCPIRLVISPPSAYSVVDISNYPQLGTWVTLQFLSSAFLIHIANQGVERIE